LSLSDLKEWVELTKVKVNFVIFSVESVGAPPNVIFTEAVDIPSGESFNCC